MSKKRRRFKLAIVAITSLFLFEGLPRAWLALSYDSPSWPFDHFGTFIDPQYPELHFRLKPNIQNESRYCHTTFSTSAEGFRGHGPVSDPNTFEMFTLGGSCIFGYGASSDSTTLAARLEEVLGEGHSVVNAGCSGYNSTQVLANLRQRVLPHKPDMVFVYTGWNDVFAAFTEGDDTGRAMFGGTFDKVPESWQDYIVAKNKRFVPQPLASSAGVMALITLWRRWDGKTIKHYATMKDTTLMTGPHGSTLILKTFKQNLLSIIRVCQEHQVPLILGTLVSDSDLIPDDRQALNEIIRALAAEHKVALVDFDKRQQQDAVTGLNFYDRFHLSDKGNAWMAKHLKQAVVELIP